MGDYVYTLRKARVGHTCKVCGGGIDPGEAYFAATIGGGGLASLKYPDYVHELCREKHEKMVEAKNGSQRH